jgi:phosphohistidine phosphatase
MKTLWILRHAHAVAASPRQPDHERALDERGLEQAQDRALYFTSANVRLDCLLVSSATRTVMTARVLAQKIEGFAKDIKVTDDLYLASAANIWQQIAQVKPDVQTLMVVAHNPGLEEFVWDCGAMSASLPTAGLFKVTFEIDDWQQAHPGSVTSIAQVV